jgi:hypothetical protein
MARNFRTATPQYLQDFIFEPDWKYLESSLIKRQTDFDKVGQMAELLGGQLKTPFLPFDEGKVRNAQEYYNNEIDSITNDLQNNRINEREAQKRIGILSRNLQDDLSTGILGAVVGRYNNFTYLDKLNEESFKKSPSDANMFKQYFYNKLEEDTYANPYTSFSPTRMVNLPLMTDDRYRKIYEKAAANLITTKSQNGRYIVKIEDLDPIELQNEIYRIYMNDPEVQAYLSQQGMLGDRRYFNVDSNGNVSLKPVYIYKDRNGNVISEEEAQKLRQAYQNLSEKEKQKTPYPIREEINPDNLFIQTANGLGDVYGFKKTTWTTDDFALEDLKYQHDLGKIAARAKWAMARDKAKHKLENPEEEKPTESTQDGFTNVNNMNRTLKDDQKLLWNRSGLSQSDISNLPEAEQNAYLRYLSSIESAKIPTINDLAKKDGWFKTNLKDFNNGSNFNVANRMITTIKDIIKKNPSIDLNNPENLNKILFKEYGNMIHITDKQMKDANMFGNSGVSIITDQVNSTSKPFRNVDKENRNNLKMRFINEITSRYLDNIKPQMEKYYKEYSETTNSTSENYIAGLSDKGLKTAKSILSSDMSLTSPQRVYIDASTGIPLTAKQVNEISSKGYKIPGMVGATNYANQGFFIITNDGRRIISSANKEATNDTNPTDNLDNYYASHPENFSNINNPVILQAKNYVVRRLAQKFSDSTQKYNEKDSNGNSYVVNKVYERIPIGNSSIPFIIKQKTDTSGNTNYEILYNSKNGGETSITASNFGNSVSNKTATQAADYINSANKRGISTLEEAGLILQEVIKGTR